MEEYYDGSLALWGLKCEEQEMTEAKFLEVFDIKEIGRASCRERV